MSLFVNILIHPFSTSAQSDIERLTAAVGIVQSIPLRELTAYETEHIQGLSGLIIELGRLASCAIWKAKKERQALLQSNE